MQKKYRLLKKGDFDKVFKSRNRIKTTNLVFYYLPNCLGRENLNNVKIGIVIPKKKWKKAKDRNYLKRIFWAANAHNNLDNLPKTLSVFLYTDFFYSQYKFKKVNFEKLNREIKQIYSIFSKRCF
ncbi:ribonuclease P protein component [Candidatus Mycoplasma haematominutum]|uniref:Ribonuclease P protein component n=1 Tax=Candidatus Mycoplasma haematominutum 'Birmingham 1' TaxID=1116213 RepID=G8C416_9MOLU|nr:ribonuclease P protein component [Candidatus Mycoplasma haematominutum]CCE67064.1 ribonuclease P, protein subunit [Candidatus Mycoplasma haematominutum 'Birmingham 1']